MPKDDLRGKIISKFHSVREFADFLGWSNRKTYNIVNGKQEPTGKDIEDMCKALDVLIPEEMKLLFF